MQSLDSLRILIEWMISGLCLIASAALVIQQDWLTATAIFALGLGINPLLKANNIIKACLTIIAAFIFFGSE